MQGFDINVDRQMDGKADTYVSPCYKQVQQKLSSLISKSNDKNGLCHAKMCLQAYADNEGPDQPVQACSLIRAFTIC